MGITLGEMVFEKILPLKPKMSNYGQALVLRENIVTEIKDSEFRPISDFSSNTY